MAVFDSFSNLPRIHAGMKRHLSQSNIALEGVKRRRTENHYLRHKQLFERDPLLNLQDEAFFRDQLLRAVSISLSAVGYDSVRPSALESFRLLAEEYMMNFLSLVRTSMTHCRRTEPIPQDFIFALTQEGLTSSELFPHLDIGIPPSLTQPVVPAPPPDEAPPPNLEPLLGPVLSGTAEKNTRPYIPSHFPSFPSTHTWRSTPVYPPRETDASKIRQKATEEGVLAEQALRKLMTAAKNGRSQRSNGVFGSRLARERQPNEMKQRRHKMFENAMKAALAEDSAAEEEERRRNEADMADFGYDTFGDDGALVSSAVRGDKMDVDVPERMLVNYDRKYWRKAGQENVWGA